MSKQIPWLRVLVEGVVIVGSILLAFGLQAWWEGRQERVLELGYGVRLKADLTADTLRFSAFEPDLAAKVSVLRQLLAADGTPPLVEDADGMMARLRFSIYVAIPETRSEAFREMESSGTLGLLRDAKLRDNLAAYYAGFGLMSGILEESYGRYRELLTGALPGNLWYSWQIDSTGVDTGDLQRGLRVLVSHPDLESAVNSELAYATAMTYYLREFKTQAMDLLTQLGEAYPQ